MAVSKAAWNKRVRSVRQGFDLLEENVPWIVENWAPELSGHPTFVEFWSSEFGEYELATEAARTYAVFAAINDGATDVETAVAVKGVGPETVKARRRQFNSGLTPDQAEAAGFKVHVNSSPEPKTRTVVVGPYSHEEYAEFEKLAQAAGSTVAKEARKAIDAWFESMVKPVRSPLVVL